MPAILEALALLIDSDDCIAEKSLTSSVDATAEIGAGEVCRRRFLGVGLSINSVLDATVGEV